VHGRSQYAGSSPGVGTMDLLFSAAMCGALVGLVVALFS
jgi:hypothetical protein